jgi:hypothetical protein
MSQVRFVFRLAHTLARARYLSPCPSERYTTCPVYHLDRADHVTRPERQPIYVRRCVLPLRGARCASVLSLLSMGSLAALREMQPRPVRSRAPIHRRALIPIPAARFACALLSPSLLFSLFLADVKLCARSRCSIAFGRTLVEHASPLRGLACAPPLCRSPLSAPDALRKMQPSNPRLLRIAPLIARIPKVSRHVLPPLRRSGGFLRGRTHQCPLITSVQSQ